MKAIKKRNERFLRKYGKHKNRRQLRRKIIAVTKLLLVFITKVALNCRRVSRHQSEQSPHLFVTPFMWR